MDWIKQTKKAIRFIEDELHNNQLSPKLIANHIHVSESHFSRAFHILTGFSVFEYVRNRRLCVAAEMLKKTDSSILDVAQSVGYESPEAFSKAFKRFHGVTPSECKISKVKEFYPLQIKLLLMQEQPLDFFIEHKKEIYLSGNVKSVPTDDFNATAYLWAQCETKGYLDRCYCFPNFETLVGVSSSDGYTIKAKCSKSGPDTSIILPPHKWAVFACQGEGPQKILQTWDQIYSNWMPKTAYEISDFPQLEVYYETDTGYKCEIWIAID